LRIVVDSWAWVEILKLSEAGRAAKTELEKAEDAFTPSVVMAELARKYLREDTDEGAVRRWLQGISEATEVYGIDIDLAMESALAALELAGKAKREGLEPPGLGDALVLATARRTGSKVLTGDRHFKGLPETIWLGG
jgi:predicted nucleic acid-binding protein